MGSGLCAGRTESAHQTHGCELMKASTQAAGTTSHASCLRSSGPVHNGADASSLFAGKLASTARRQMFSPLDLLPRGLGRPITVRLATEELEQISAVAEELGASRSALMRLAMVYGLRTLLQDKVGRGQR